MDLKELGDHDTRLYEPEAHKFSVKSQTQGKSLNSNLKLNQWVAVW